MLAGKATELESYFFGHLFVLLLLLFLCMNVPVCVLFVSFGFVWSNKIEMCCDFLQVHGINKI